MQISTTTMESHMESPQKAKDRTAITNGSRKCGMYAQWSFTQQ
jgi:hypothetical protein